MTQVRVFHNVATDEEGRNPGFRGYRPEHPVTLVAEFAVEDATDFRVLLELVHYELNIDLPTEPWAVQYRQRRNRSLSVGDLVEIDGQVFACTSDGWDQVGGQPVITDVAQHGTMPLSQPHRHPADADLHRPRGPWFGVNFDPDSRPLIG